MEQMIAVFAYSRFSPRLEQIRLPLPVEFSADMETAEAAAKQHATEENLIFVKLVPAAA